MVECWRQSMRRRASVARRLGWAGAGRKHLVLRPGNRIYVAVTDENEVAAIDVQTFEVVQTIATGNRA